MKKLFFIIFLILSTKQSNALGLINNVKAIEKNPISTVKIEKKDSNLFNTGQEQEADAKNFWEDSASYVVTLGGKCLALIFNDFLKFYN